MRKLYITLTLIAVSLKSYSVGFDASYNATIVSFYNLQLSARNLIDGFGIYTSIRGVGNGKNTSSSMEINDFLLSIQNASDEFEVAYSDEAICRSGVSLGISKKLKFLFVSAALGYCDNVKYQKTTISSKSTSMSRTFNDLNGVNRKFEWEAMFGATPEYGRIYIPFYAGYSFNYSTFFGIGIGYNF